MNAVEEETVLETLDAGLDPVCEFGVGEPIRPHGAAADWLMTLPCCGASATYCEPHRGDVVDILHAFDGMLACAVCGAKAEPSFVPIRAGR